MRNAKQVSFKKILIANRGEIAIRVIRACRELGISPVAVYSDADRSALHVRRADEAYYLGPSPAPQSYLDPQKILKAAKKAKVDAIHPGYGFLSENADFAEAVKKAGIAFIGPQPDVIRKMGSKVGCRQLAKQAKVPLVPGVEKAIPSVEEAKEIAKRIGYPVLLKASAGGGGKGMRTVQSESELAAAFTRAKAEALQAFKDDAVYLEKLIEQPHHIEVQVFGDHHGNVVHFFERECSIQRRHQKVIEEAPSPFITAATRKKICETALRLAKLVNYQGAGTLEFLADKHQNFYFLEMNTRIQVEHPVTEMITGADLVKLQIEVAQGKPLPFTQKDITATGHAMECRIYAEDPFHNFMPSPGLVVDQQYPHGPGVRLDNGIYAGYTIPLDYDPVLSKLITHGADRSEALSRMRRALSEYRVSGVKTNLYFHRRVMDHPEFIKGGYSTQFIEKHLEDLLKPNASEALLALAGAAVAKAMEDKKSHVLTDAHREATDLSAWRRTGKLRGYR